MLLVAACGGEATPRVGGEVEPGFEYAGCRGLWRSDDGALVCEPGRSQQLRFFLPDTPDAPSTDDESSDAPQVEGGTLIEDTRLPGGRRIVVEVAPETSSVSVRSPRRDARLRIARVDAPPWVGEARQLGRSGELDAARELLRRHLEASPPTPPRSAERDQPSEQDPAEPEPGIGDAWGLLAVVEMGLGNGDAAEQALLRAVAEHRASAQLYDEVNDTTRLVFRYLEARRFTAARGLLDALPDPADGSAEMAYLVAYYRGVLAEAVGDTRNALAWLREAVVVAERLGLGRNQMLAEQVLARVLQGLGRGDEAAAIYRRLRRHPPIDLEPCDRAQLLNNQAWSMLLARESGNETTPVDEEPGDATPPHPLELLRAAGVELDDPAAAPCAAVQRVNLALNRALALHQDGATDEARQALDEALRLDPDPDPWLALWRLDLDARIALEADRTGEALRGYEHLAELARDTASPEAAWRAAVGRAQALEAEGRSGEALERWAEAEALLEQEALAIPLGEGRDTFAAGRELATRRYLTLLLATGHRDRAFEVARRSRARALRTVRRGDRLAQLDAADQRLWDDAIARYREEREALDRATADDWRLASDRLAEVQREREARRAELQQVLDEAFAVLGPGIDTRLPDLVPGDLTLLYHPTDQGWVGFAALDGTLQVELLPDLDPMLTPAPSVDPGSALGPLADRLLRPFAGQIDTARRIRWLPYGGLRALDLHTLPWDGAVLLSHRPVVYGLDLRSQTRGSTGEGALVVGDPQGDLPAAAEEARRVAEALADHLAVERLEGPDAQGSTLRERLPSRALFHYAGHGEFAGTGGWRSALPLANGSRLALGDVLTLPRAPDTVVLSGCETGRTAVAAPVEALGLAQAFLVAGSRQVVATTRPVTDAGASRFVATFYEHALAEAAPGSPLDLAEALRQAQLAWRDAEPEADWASFRVLEP